MHPRPAGPGGHADSGTEMCLSPLLVAQGGQRVTGMDPDPEVVGPAGQVRSDPGPGLLSKTSLGERDSNISIEGGLLLRIDPAESLAHHDRLSSEASAAKVEDEVHEPLR